MPLSTKCFRIFVASPGDVAEERDHLRKVVEELNMTIAPFHGFSVEFIRWETHCFPAAGRAQGVVNLQIGAYDIFIGIMWKRFGTPTGVSNSGTEEEFRIAYKAWQEDKLAGILFYFCQKPFMPRAVEELEQCHQVLKFKEELSQKMLIWEYDGHDVFSDTVRPHLTRLLLETVRKIDALEGVVRE